MSADVLNQFAIILSSCNPLILHFILLVNSTCKESGHKWESGSELYRLSDGNADRHYSNNYESEGEDLPAAFTPIKKTPGLPPFICFNYPF